MKDILSIIGVLAIICCVSYFVQNMNSNEFTIEDRTEQVHELEYEIEELRAEINKLEEKYNSLEMYSEELELEIENNEEYIEELQQLLEDNNIDEWDGIDIELTDGSNNKSTSKITR